MSNVFSQVSSLRGEHEDCSMIDGREEDVSIWQTDVVRTLRRRWIVWMSTHESRQLPPHINTQVESKYR